MEPVVAKKLYYVRSKVKHLLVITDNFYTFQTQGKTSGFLEAMLMTLSSWKRSSSSFPVLTWQQFGVYVRSKVNPLAGDDHLKHLIQQLQVIGEVTFHYENTPMQYTEIFYVVKLENFRWIFFNIFSSPEPKAHR